MEKAASTANPLPPMLVGGVPTDFIDYGRLVDFVVGNLEGMLGHKPAQVTELLLALSQIAYEIASPEFEDDDDDDDEDEDEDEDWI